MRNSRFPNGLATARLGAEAYGAGLANCLTVYPETLNLKTEISLQPVGTRPFSESRKPITCWLRSSLPASLAQERWSWHLFCFIRNDSGPEPLIRGSEC